MDTKRKAILEFALGGILFCALCLVGVRLTNPGGAAATAGGSAPPVVVIDPGHGGEDGGASVNGVLEKELNLQVAQIVFDLCRLNGIPAVMTRSEDTMLYDRYHECADYASRKKLFDLKNRVRMAEEADAALFVSIHMNKFPQADCRGLQVYYSGNHPDGKIAAELIASRAKTYLQPENHRETKKATSAIYVLYRISVPAVLVECGFLSNPEEAALLQSREYQQKLGLILYSAIAEYRALAGSAG